MMIEDVTFFCPTSNEILTSASKETANDLQMGAEGRLVLNSCTHPLKSNMILLYSLLSGWKDPDSNAVVYKNGYIWKLDGTVSPTIIGAVTWWCRDRQERQYAEVAGEQMDIDVPQASDTTAAMTVAPVGVEVEAKDTGESIFHLVLLFFVHILCTSYVHLIFLLVHIHPYPQPKCQCLKLSLESVSMIRHSNGIPRQADRPIYPRHGRIN